MCAAPVFANGADAPSEAFTRTVERLNNEKTKSDVRYGSDGIKVVCTVLPNREVTAVAWKIYNPKRIELKITQDDIRLSDQVRQLSRIEPARASDLLYGSQVVGQTMEPFVDGATPPEFLEPPIQTEPQAQEDLLDSAFNFVVTDSSLIAGLTYYKRYGANERVRSEITLNGQTLTFNFGKE